MKYSYTDLAGMIDHALLHPTMTEKEMRAGCELAARYQVASVCIKPYAVKLAAALLRGTGVAVGTVIGFPHGSNATELKRYETALACNDGAVEIDMVVNIGAALGGDWEFVAQDVRAVCDEAHGPGALVKVIFETDYLTEDAAKIRLCEISEEAGAEFVKTSTGFGFVKQPGGGYDSRGATEHDLSLMRANTSPKVHVKASGGVRTLDALIAARDLGSTRCGTSATAQLLDEYRRRDAEGDAGPDRPSAAELGGGY